MQPKVALIEPKPSSVNYSQVLFEYEIEFTRFALCSDPSKAKILARDVDIDFDPSLFDYVVLVGSEPLKFFTKATRVMDYCGVLLEDKFLPIFSPAMLKFKPEVKHLWEDAKHNIQAYIAGRKVKSEIGVDFIGIQDEVECIAYIQRCIDSPLDYFGIDSETTGLYPRNGYPIGISLCSSNLYM